ncbi:MULTISPECIES: LysE family translocator [Paenibacillus]|uniref:Lysine transporter LysE n=1 Tax=Paenibacillus campinasensis TaxID=66347 RepID=A0ABW9T554_9BACL|nr:MULTISPECIES: LysE family transporter [Paenibacillus]MUG68445.1 lysine transporter LysE [Paenibacillus campinasensis]PAK50603.1 lysine transporter LysE [Paenibacillus sp. 7541]
MPMLSFLLFVFVNSFTPGPNNFMAMSFGNKYGLKKTMTFCLGVGAGFFALALLCSFFNLVLINLLPVIKLPLTILGVGYMLYLAFKTLTSNNDNHHGRERNEGRDRNLFVMGVLLQFINPKGVLYGITVVATFLLPYYNSYFSYFIFSLFLGAVGIMSSCSWGLFGVIFQKVLVQYRRPFNVIMALLLVYSAISIVLH